MAQERVLAGAEMLGLEQDPDWVNKFMRLIFEKDYDAAREVLRKAVAYGVEPKLAQQYAKVLEEFLQVRDGLPAPQSRDDALAKGGGGESFGLGNSGNVVLKEYDERGNGLMVRSFTLWGDVLWNERPLAYIQSPCSRKCVQVCLACMTPVGTLASQLEHMGLQAPAGAEEVKLQTPGSATVVPCGAGGCAEVFCSSTCREWALSESSHAILCRGRLPAGCADALGRLEELAESSDTEHLLLLAHSVAQMLRRRLRGEAEEELLHRCARQFARKPWDSLAENGNGSDETDTPESRRGLMDQAFPLLREIFAFADAETANPLLDPEVLSNLLGAYELCNMCISISHTLNYDERVAGLLAGTGDVAKIAKIQSLCDDSSDSEDEAEGTAAEPIAADETEAEKDKVEEEEETEELTEEEALEKARSGLLFTHVMGTALCETLAFTNHCCMPNCAIEFATPAEELSGGPGLWVHCVARRPMMPGDELLMCYVPSVVGKPLEVRQRRLRKFGFLCRCRTCVTDEMLAAEDVPMPGG